MFEKSATELKPKQKLLKCKSTIHIATFNIEILNRTGQLLELTKSAAEHNVDMVCIQEHRYHHSEVYVKHHNTCIGWIFISASAWKTSVNAIIGGFRMLLGSRTLKSLNSIEKLQPKMMVATFNGNTSTTIISSYSLTNASGETDLDTFYNELSSLIHSIPKYNVQITGDMNAKIGKNKNKFSLHNLSNRNGEFLIFHLKMDQHALILNIRKERENYGPTLTQIMLKHR